MATKTQSTQSKSVDKLTGTITGKRFVVKLDDIKKGDKWDPAILPVLQADGIGKTHLNEGVTSFTFRTSDEATIAFTASEGLLVISDLTVKDDMKGQA